MTATEGGSDEHGTLSVTEAGRRGGERVKQRYGSAYYAEIGKKVGEAVKSTTPSTTLGLVARVARHRAVAHVPSAERHEF